MKALTFAAVVGMVLTIAAPVMAQQPIFTFDFEELNGIYNGAASFDALSTSISRGKVTRLAPTAGTAWYDVDYSGSVADYSMTMTLSNITGTTADAVGSFTIVDADGDTLTGDMDGSWSKVGGFAAFNGILTNVAFSDPFGTFDGPGSAGSFSTDFSGYGPSPYDGAIVTLVTSSWFDVGTAWTDRNTQVDGAVIPVPGAALLGVIGLGVVSRVRRRLA